MKRLVDGWENLRSKLGFAHCSHKENRSQLIRKRLLSIEPLEIRTLLSATLRWNGYDDAAGNVLDTVWSTSSGDTLLNYENLGTQ
ncbi:MAG: hypothetical protein IT426_07685 [Pirellulales bacterium]|nr:hypothetical protein [Pirellulales bacterium]